MKYLLDTQIFVLWMQGSKRLKEEIREILKSPQNTVYLSVASVWEMVIKKKLGKLRLPRDWKETLKESRFEILSIILEHAYAVESLPLLHRDPFDRMLIAQAITEKATLITGDSKMKKYKANILSA